MSSHPEAGLDLIRVHGHITRPEVYEAADELGMLIWQDLPLQWGYARSVGKQAARQAAEAVDLLGHHPSVAIWCGHNEPLTLDVRPGEPVASKRTAIELVSGQELPSWNRSILDARIKRTLERADGTRPVIAHSGIAPHLPQLDGTDSHLYFGWYHGEERDLPAFAAAWPRMVRFVSEFGAQAVPADAAFMEPERWPDLDWERLQGTTLQKVVFDERVPPADHATFAELAGGDAALPGPAPAPPHRATPPEYRPPGASASSAWPMPSPRSRGRCSGTTARPSGRTTSSRRRVARSSSSRTGCRRAWPPARPWPSTSTSCPTVACRSRAPPSRPSCRGPAAIRGGGGGATSRRTPAWVGTVQIVVPAIRPARARPRPRGRRGAVTNATRPDHRNVLRHPPLRFGWLLLAPLGNASSAVAVVGVHWPDAPTRAGAAFLTRRVAAAGPGRRLRCG
jgi:hypothetical protein